MSYEWEQYEERYTLRPETYEGYVDVWNRVPRARSEFTGWAISDAGSTTVAPGSVLRITGGCGPWLENRALVIQGRLEFANFAQICMNGSASVLNNGTVDIEGDGVPFRRWDGAPSVLNTGVLKKSGGSSSAQISAAFTNQGTVQIQAGLLSLEEGPPTATSELGSYSVVSGAELSIAGGTRVWGSGTSVSGGGRLSISAPQLELTGGVSVNVGELSVGSVSVRLASDSLYPTLRASLSAPIAPGSRLTIASVAPYCPDIGKQFPFVLGAPVSGVFGAVDSTAIGRTFTLNAVSGGLAITSAGGDCDFTPPTIAGALVQRPITAQDSLLEGRFGGISASDSGSGVDLIEYQWGQGSVFPASWEIDGWSGSGHATVSYEGASPNSSWTLRVRARDWMGNVSPILTTTVTTPTAPYLLAIGDSITAGHHRDGALILTECEDPEYSYANRYYERLKNSVPAQWRNGFEYDNVAHSGYTTQKVLGDAADMADACGVSHASPIERARAELVGVASPHRSTWKRAVMTVGVNNTNWSERLRDIRAGEIADPLFEMWALGLCQNRVDAWDGWDGSKFDEVRDGVAEILRLLDPYGTRVLIPEYYNAAGSGFLNIECAGPIGDGVERLDAMVDAGIRKHTEAEPQAVVRQQSVGSFVGGDDIQPWFVGTDEIIQIGCLFRPCPVGSVPGWPHPNPSGAKRIGDALPVRVFGWGS